MLSVLLKLYRCDETSIPMARKVHDTALYLNEKVHTLSKLLIEQRKKDPVGACMFSLELFSSIVDPDLLSFFESLTKSAHTYFTDACGG